MPEPILIAGPTASGKTQLALSLAAEFNGVIINTDSCQVYSELEIISARPGADEMTLAPHHLFGHVSGAVAYSTGAWLRDVQALMKEFKANERRMIFVGGTGLYFQALLEGLSEVPDIEEAVRTKWRDQAAALGAPALHDQLQELDPEVAGRLKPGDTQRIIRALEVLEGTGRSLTYWQAQKTEPLLASGGAHRFVVTWPREILYQRINQRFGQMVERGGLDEVAALRAFGFDRSLPIMRALGVPELMAHIEGELTLDEAIERAAQQTRRYAKRQMTWIRGNMIAWNKLAAQEMERNLPEIVSNIHQNG
ncbi:MAG: tRNA dimethylallyltransferase [Rhodomicrobium sp.]|nr:MAG: tRNA dimethylallyltransferase [Rhodomicrobium sp.]